MLDPAVQEPSQQTQPSAAPLPRAERISNLDTIRGIALLGILLMNILDFGLPLAYYWNPALGGHTSPPNLWAWGIQWIFFEGKMRGLFSLMFGASVVLLVQRLERKNAGLLPADVHYRRMLWMLLFGLIHAYLIWYGDILYPYALCGLFLFPMRKLSVRALIIASTLIFLASTAFEYRQFEVRDLMHRAEQAKTLKAQGKTLTKKQSEDLAKWTETRAELYQQTKKQKDDIAKEIKTYRTGTYPEMVQSRAGVVLKWHSEPLYAGFAFDMLAMMLLGMALLKNGVLTGHASTRTYVLMALLGLGSGLVIGGYRVWSALQWNFEPTLFNLEGTFSYQLSRLPMVLGYIGLITLILRKGWLGGLFRALAAVGQTAFSNYILTSILCTLVFYSYGLGYFGKWERYQVYGVVPLIWAINLILSPWWLKRYQYGPLEWVWRSLTYWQRPPLRIQPSAATPE